MDQWAHAGPGVSGPIWAHGNQAQFHGEVEPPRGAADKSVNYAGKLIDLFVYSSASSHGLVHVYPPFVNNLCFLLNDGSFEH